MTECERVLVALERYCDDEVSHEERVLIDRHLRRCSKCTSREDFQRGLKEIIRTKCEQAELPIGLAERIRSVLSGPS